MVGPIAAIINRTKIATRETSQSARTKLLVSFVATIAVRASTQRFGKIRVTWAEIGLDLRMVITCYVVILALFFVWNWIFAPARLKQKLGQASLNQMLTPKADEAAKSLDELMDTDEDAEYDAHTN